MIESLSKKIEAGQILKQKLAIIANVQKTVRGKHDYLVEFRVSSEERM